MSDAMVPISSAQDASSAALIAEDVGADVNDSLPSGLTRIGRVVQWQGTPSFAEVTVLIDADQTVRPGQLLGVWHGRRGTTTLTVIEVVACSEVNPNEAPDLAAAREALGLSRAYAREGVSTRVYRIAECPTLEEFDVADDKEGNIQPRGASRTPELLARAGDAVVLLPANLAVASLGGLPDGDSGLELGSISGPSDVPIALTPQALQMHIGVFGNPGKGKSYLVGNLIEEAMRWKIPSLVLDVNGELVAVANSLGGQVIRLPDPQQFGLTLNLLTPPELVSIAPNVQPGTIYAELIELAHDELKTAGRVQRITFADLKTRIQQIGERTEAKKASIGAAVARVGALEKDRLFAGEYDFVGAIRDKNLVVLDCRFLSLRQTRLIAAAAARELQRVGREMAQKAEDGDLEAASWFALYFVDEAHLVIPDDEEVVSTQVLFELARMGRHVRTGLVLSSQSPQDLHTSVLKRLQTRFVFALERDQLRSIQGVAADLDERLLAQLPKLPRGTCAVSGASELIRHGFLLRVRKRVTPVRGGTPDIFGGRSKRSLEV